MPGNLCTLNLEIYENHIHLRILINPRKLATTMLVKTRVPLMVQGNVGKGVGSCWLLAQVTFNTLCTM